MRDEIARLAKALEPSFAAPEDAELAATMMVMALRYELGQPDTEVDQLRYRAAMERLPKGSTATPHVVFVSPYDQKTDPHRRVTFTAGSTRYETDHWFLVRQEVPARACDGAAWLRPNSGRAGSGCVRAKVATDPAARSRRSD
jgi:hypothetical protein